MLKNLLLQFYTDFSCSFFGLYVWVSNFIYLLKGKNKDTLFSLPAFGMLDLFVVMFCYDPFHNAAYVWFFVLLLAQSRLTMTRLVRKARSAKCYVHILEVISLISLSDFRKIVLFENTDMLLNYRKKKNRTTTKQKNPNSTRYATGAKQ